MGDSAGGLLAAIVTNSGNQLTSGQFTSGHLLFKPTWLPENVTAEQLAKSDMLRVQATILAYAGTNLYEACKYGMETKDNFFWSAAKVTPRGILGEGINVNNHPDYYKAVSPMYTIPSSLTRKLAPQLYLQGSKDNIVLPIWAKAYVKAIKDAGQPVEYWEYANEPHAFLNTNEDLGTKFEKDAPTALNKTIDFLNKIFYP
jgi:acetyl esterase/lipase